MYRVKPGRGPSFKGGFMGIVAVLFGIYWTYTAASIDSRGEHASAAVHIFFPLFGVLFIIAAIGRVIYNFKNATSKDRYSSLR